jgi:hypothetical protein
MDGEFTARVRNCQIHRFRSQNESTFVELIEGKISTESFDRTRQYDDGKISTVNGRK